MDEDNNKPQKKFLKKGQGKLMSNAGKDKLHRNKSEKSFSFLKKGKGKLAWQHNESDKSFQDRQDNYELQQSKMDLIDYNIRNKKSIIQNVRNRYKKDVEFVDTIQARIKQIEYLSQDKFNYTF